MVLVGRAVRSIIIRGIIMILGIVMKDITTTSPLVIVERIIATAVAVIREIITKAASLVITTLMPIQMALRSILILKSIILIINTTTLKLTKGSSRMIIVRLLTTAIIL
jgi:hypothetical protein